MKIIKVESCRECPHVKRLRGDVLLYCLKMSELLTIKIIDDNCPLEDEQDLTPALELLQGYLESGNYISYNSGRIWGCESIVLFRRNGEEIVSGKTIRELLVNLVKRGV